MGDQKPEDGAEDKTPKDDIKRRIDDLDKKIDTLEDEAVPKQPDPPGVGAMF
jgi:hypothetical protein